MKKTLIALLTLACCLSASAQSMYDAYNMSQTNYIASAKVLGLGSAVTALGGDLGTIAINPAGSAVAGYSQFTISPSLSFSVVGTSYSLSPTSPYDPSASKVKSVFKLPNLGMSGRYDTPECDHLRSFTFAFVLNSVNDYNFMSVGSGMNASSSKFAEMASAACGIAPSVLGSSSFYSNSSYSNYWDAAMGYDVGLINSYGTENKYVGCSEVLASNGDHYVPSELRQTSTITHIGGKTDIELNCGFNIEDRLFLGFNLNIPVISYANIERFDEVAQVVEDFPIQFTYSNGTVEDTNFSDASYQYNYNLDGSGVNMRFGAIWLPTNSLRLGFAYQTRTMYEMQETWQHSGRVHYTNGTSYSGSGEQGYYEYEFYSPSILDAGIAWTFGRMGLVSVDYEMTDYSRMKFKSMYDDPEEYSYTNAAMKAFSGASHSLRAGVEVNLTPDFSLRGGYSFTTSPEKYYTEGGIDITYNDYNDDYYLGRSELPYKHSYYGDMTSSYSLGFGYHPVGSFFLDFAARLTTYPDSVYQPYYDYADVYAPRFLQKRGLVNAVLTLGWRF